MRNRPIQLTVFLAALFLLAAPRCSAAATTKEQIADSLRQTISVEFEQTPLDEVVNYLREVLGVNLVLDVEGDAAEMKFITLRLRDVPASSVLHWVTRLANLEYTITDHAIYIAPQRRIALMGQAYFRQYDVTDLLVPLEGALWDDDDNDDDDNNDGDNNGNARTRAQRELMQLILIFTGGPSSWDHFAIIGAGANDNEDDRVSEEDIF